MFGFFLQMNVNIFQLRYFHGHRHRCVYLWLPNGWLWWRFFVIKTELGLWVLIFILEYCIAIVVDIKLLRLLTCAKWVFFWASKRDYYYAFVNLPCKRPKLWPDLLLQGGWALTRSNTVLESLLIWLNKSFTHSSPLSISLIRTRPFALQTFLALRLASVFEGSLIFCMTYIRWSLLLENVVMIKIIVTLVCAFSSMLMLIISMATTYWIQWVIPNPAHGTNLTNFQGLIRQCWELRNNVTDELIKDGCEGLFEKSPPGTFCFVLMWL